MVSLRLSTATVFHFNLAPDVTDEAMATAPAGLMYRLRHTGSMYLFDCAGHVSLMDVKVSL